MILLFPQKEMLQEVERGIILWCNSPNKTPKQRDPASAPRKWTTEQTGEVTQAKSSGSAFGTSI